MASDPVVGLNQIGTSSPVSEHAGAPAWRRKFLALPPAAWSRVLVIFGGLSLAKLVLLFSLRKHLQEIHWRAEGDPVTWVGTLAFYGVAALIVYTLMELGRQCQAGGARRVRVINALVLGFGGLFIFLTFHEGDKNYIYPVITGVLRWVDLWSYLSLNLFFRPPYLAGWMFVYAAGYYFLLRTGRERLVLWLTAVFAGAYWVFCGREFLFRQRDLWVVLLFGLLSALLLANPKRAFHPAWQWVVVAWTLLMWGLFSLGSSDVAELPPYFVMLAGCLTVLFAGASWLARRAGAWPPWSKVVGFYFIALLLLADANYPPARNLNNVLRFSAEFPHYFLGELLVAGGLALLALLYARLRPGGRWWWLDVVGLGLMLITLLDLRLTQIMGVRLGWDVLAFGADPRMMWRLARPHLPVLAIVGMFVGLAYALVVRKVGKQLAKRSESAQGRSWAIPGAGLISGFALLAVLGSVITKRDNAEGQGVVRLAQSSPLWKRTVARPESPEVLAQNARKLGMLDWAASVRAEPSPSPRELNVLLVFQESTYNQHLSLFSGDQPTQPRLSRYQDRMEVFPNFFSSFAGSIHARFATFTGLYPIVDFNQFTLERVPVKSIFEVLGDNGYECTLFYSSFLDYTGFRSFLKNRHLAAMYDADTMPGGEGTERVSWGLKEETTVRAIQQQIREYATNGRKFFLTYVPAAPHYPYDKIPREFRKYQLGQMGDYTPLYLNELLYMDANIASILDELKSTGLLDKTVVVITADHGEMLGQDGGPTGHGWKLTPQLANVPLIIMDPGRTGYRINNHIGSQVDLLPTVLDVLRLPLPAGELYQGQSLQTAEQNPGRTIYLNSYADYAVITGNELRFGNRQNDAPPTAASLTPVYQIGNRGAATVFTETNQPTREFSIQHFDEFQESLLRNYGFYRDSLSHREVAQARPTSR